MGFCTYITFYHGSKMPPFYIGSSSIDRVSKGYHGSVTSKTYSAIWKEELRDNPSLFKTRIIRTYPTRKEALVREKTLQEKLSVVRSSMYINLSTASKNGFFGMPMAGRKHSAETCELLSVINLGKKASDKTKAKMSAAHKGKQFSEQHVQNMKVSRNARGPMSEQAHCNLSKAKAGPNNPNYGKRGPKTSMFGKSHSSETREAMSLANKGALWWNNGTLCKRSRECPGSEWSRGRLS